MQRHQSGFAPFSWVAWLAVILSGLLLSESARGAEPVPRVVEFNRDIRPILSNHCFTCHGPDAEKREADLRLDTRDGLLSRESADSGLIVPGDRDASLLYQRVAAPDADLRMPPADAEQPLTARQIALLGRWIDQGADWQDHWFLRPPGRVSPPDVRNASWPENPIDRFILSRLEKEGLQPSPPADEITLIRRLSFDLRGLPPALDEVEDFTADNSPMAYDRLVDGMLASPHFGERMAIYWLDLVRYADTVGYHGDQEREVSPYRDYVINAFNANLPFDQFTVEQLAGDLLPDPTLAQKVASGYNMLGMTTIEGGAQPKEYLAKYASDRVRNASSVWMGATLGCAECHDHKFDPYTMRDFYSFAAFFADLRQKGVGNPAADLAVPNADEQRQLDRIAEEVALLEDELQNVNASQSSSRQTESEIASAAAKIQMKIDELMGRQKEILDHARHTIPTVSVEPRVMRILPRGNWLDETGEIVTPAVPDCLPPLNAVGSRATRLDLARWLVSPDHPQTARVFVNRLWKLFFGTGLSKTLDDLGTQGERPSHPELLDWLAVEFIDSGWDVKHMVRLMVTSRTYRQSSLVSDELRRGDPFNRLLARQSRFRIDAEMVRDNALAVSGLLVREIGGDSAKPYQPEGYYAHLNFPKRTYKSDTGSQQYRRGVYTHWQRTFLHPALLAFDAPSREECTAERPISNTPLAALVLLNDPSFVEAARVFAVRILESGGTNAEQRAIWAWRQVLSRTPKEREVRLLVQLYENHHEHYQAHRGAAEKLLSVGLSPRPAGHKLDELAAWTSVARALLNLNETITRN